MHRLKRELSRGLTAERPRHRLVSRRLRCLEPAMPPRSPFPVFGTNADSRAALLQGLLIGAIVVAVKTGERIGSAARPTVRSEIPVGDAVAVDIDQVWIQRPVSVFIDSYLSRSAVRTEE